MNFLFIIPTAVNHLEGPSDILNEALNSVSSINQFVTNNQIVVLDYALTPLTEQQKNQLTTHVDLIAQHQKNEVVETVDKKYQNQKKQPISLKLLL